MKPDRHGSALPPPRASGLEGMKPKGLSVKLKLLMGVAIAALSATHAFAQTGPDTSVDTDAADTVVIIGQGQTRHADADRGRP